MNDDAPETPAPAPPKPPKSSKLLPILMALNLGGTGAAVFLQLKPRPALAVAAAHAEKEQKPEEKKPGPVVALDPFIVNLNEEGSSRYLKATFEVEVLDEAAKKALEMNKRVVRDDVLRYLSGLGVVDTQGEAGKSKIQAEVQARVDEALGGDKVVHVFFTDFVVQ